MPDPWPVEILHERDHSGNIVREFEKVPESWIDHPKAVDEDEGPHPARLYAVSVQEAVENRKFRIRYAHPRTCNVLHYTCGAVNPDRLDGPVPANLEVPRKTWARSLVPPPDVAPQDVLRQPEIDHMAELWGDRLGPTVGNDRRVVP